MFTIMDYAKYYKDITVSEVSMNESDILVMTIFSYMPIEAFEGEKSFDSVVDEILAADYSKPLWLMAPKVREISEILKGSLRYKDMVLQDFAHEVNERYQFGAVTFSFDGNKIIAYEGSDGSASGWFENFRVAYLYPTETQSLAIKYMEDHVTQKDHLYFAGHSKGGNLAVTAGMACPYKDSIKLVYNFDGPGFQKEEIHSREFQEIQEKIRNIIPENSYLGVLLHNDARYLVCKSCEKGFYIHYPTSWEIFGGFIVCKSEMSDISKYLHTLTTQGFDSLNHEEAEKTLEGTFQALKLSKGDKFRITFRGFLNAMDSIHKSDEGVRQFLKKTIGIMWLATKRKNISLEEIENAAPEEEQK